MGCETSCFPVSRANKASLNVADLDGDGRSMFGIRKAREEKLSLALASRESKQQARAFRSQTPSDSDWSREIRKAKGAENNAARRTKKHFRWFAVCMYLILLLAAATLL